MGNLIPILAISAVAVILLISTIAFLISRYRRCSSDEVLVIFGKGSKDKDGKITPTKTIHGGGAFVWPVIQDYKKMSLAPIQIQETIFGRSKENINVQIPITLTTGIGMTNECMQNAAARVLSMDPDAQKELLKDILVGEIRNLIAQLTVLELKEDRDKFLGNARKQIEPELNKLGFEITNLNSADVKDDALILESLSKKAATLAKATADADIAEQDKIGKVKVANTKKDEAIELAKATKEQQTIVAKTDQEREVEVASVTKEKEIQLAETLKEQSTSIANLDAEREAAVAQAQAVKAAKIAEAKAEADTKTAEQNAKAQANIAKAEAEATSIEAEAEASKQVRVAQAKAKQDAETAQAIQEKEANIAEYESQKRQKAAEAAKKAGVAEQEATIEVSKARGLASKAAAEADKVAGMSKIEAEMEVRRVAQEKQLEVNEAEAKAQAAKLNAELVVKAEADKKTATIEAEKSKAVKVLEAEAKAESVTKEANAQAEAIIKVGEAEAAMIKLKGEAEASAKKASLMAEADAAVQRAEGLSKAEIAGMRDMVSITKDPQAVLDYFMKDVRKEIGVAEAYSKTLEHTISGQVAIYGNASTASDFASSMLSLVPKVREIGQVLGEGVSAVKGAINSPAVPQFSEKPKEKELLLENTNAKCEEFPVVE